MKIVLCTLPVEGEYNSWVTPGISMPKAVKYIPLGLLSLASNVKGHDIKILDPFSEGWNIQETIARVENEHADVVGFSAETRRVYSLYKLLDALKDVKWKICGGPHATYYSEMLLRKGADAVFAGPLADRELQRWLSKPEKGVIKCDSPLPLLHYPDRRLIDYEKYFYTGKVLFEAKKRMVMFTSIGCPHGCKFCSVQSKKIQRKSTNVVLDEMEYLRDLGAESIHFLDDNCNISNEFIVRLLKEMKDRSWNMEWSMRGQVKFDLSLVPALRECGMKRFHVGIEALDDSILKTIGKKQTVADVRKMCEVMTKNDIDILAYFMVGTPGETKEYLDSLPSLIRELGIKHPFANVLFPEPNTEYGDSVAKGLWEAYMENPTPDYVLPIEPPKQAMQYAEWIVKEFM